MLSGTSRLDCGLKQKVTKHGRRTRSLPSPEEAQELLDLAQQLGKKEARTENLKNVSKKVIGLEFIKYFIMP